MQRNRSQTLPPGSTAPKHPSQHNNLSPADEADDELSNASLTSPIMRSTSPVAISNRPPREAQSSSSLVGSLYALGNAVWSIVRGPVDTDSVDELAINSDSETSEAPDFEHPSPAKNMYSLSNTSLDAVKDAGKERRSIAEAGRDKIVISQATSKCKLIGRDFPSSEHILSQQELELIHDCIPSRWKLYTNWFLLYSTRGNGFSLATLYNQVKAFRGPIIFALKSDTDEVFGAFSNQTLQRRQGHYGNGETFLWKLDPTSHALVKYPSTGKNNYFLVSEADYVAVGCGAGKFGLWLDGDLFKGSTAPVPTFDNEALCQRPEFECQGVEIWGLDLDCV